MMADFTLDDVTRPDVVMVPGGIDVRPVKKEERVLAWLRAVVYAAGQAAERRSLSGLERFTLSSATT